MTLSPQPGILSISPYVGGASKLEGQTDVLKLSSNENLAGPCESARKVYQNMAQSLFFYPDSSHLNLRSAIADVYGLDAARISCGAGSDELISLLCQAFAGPGDEVLHTEHGFDMYRISALAAGATPVRVPEAERYIDVDNLIAACTERTKIIFVANPNNPTGTMVPSAELNRLAEGIPSHVLLVIDGAYAEYVERYDGGASIVEAHENVVMTRTFSKIYGLGGMRVGWCYASVFVTDILQRMRGPFNLSSPALAVAEAAVRDQEWVEKCRASNAQWRDWMRSELIAHLPVEVDPSCANFLLVRFSDEPTAIAADAFLREQGIIVRRVVNYGFPNALRITTAGEAACKRVTSSMRRYFEAREP